MHYALYTFTKTEIRNSHTKMPNGTMNHDGSSLFRPVDLALESRRVRGTYGVWYKYELLLEASAALSLASSALCASVMYRCSGVLGLGLIILLATTLIITAFVKSVII